MLEPRTATSWEAGAAMRGTPVKTLKVKVSRSGAAKQDLETETVGSASAKRTQHQEGSLSEVNWTTDAATRTGPADSEGSRR